ncbi:MAG: hypothetical protein ROO73_00715 [Roseivirga sp.]
MPCRLTAFINQFKAKKRYAIEHHRLFSLTAVCSTSVWAKKNPGPSEAHSLATDIADYYTKSFPTINEAPQEERKDQKDYEARPAKLSEKTKREVVFNSIFKKSPCYTQL